jgi:hypothetical protein
MCIVQVMKMAAGAIEFVCLMFSHLTDISNRLDSNRCRFNDKNLLKEAIIYIIKELVQPKKSLNRDFYI